MVTALLIFPCVAILWLLVVNRLGLVRDEPPIDYTKTIRAVAPLLEYQVDLANGLPTTEGGDKSAL